MEKMLFLIEKFLRRMKKNGLIFKLIYDKFDNVFRIFDNLYTRSYNHLKFIPPAKYRFGGQSSLMEYAYTAGLFSGIIASYAPIRKNKLDGKINILDFGCGTGKLIVAALPFVRSGGQITGIDLGNKEIEFCKSFFPSNICSFNCVSVRNASYNPDGETPNKVDWFISKSSIDVITALSVFTHLNEEDAYFYMKKINHTLSPDGIAILTFFLLNDYYDPKQVSGNRWIFNANYPNSTEWRYPSNIKVPEAQIGVTLKGLQSLIQDTDLSIEKIFEGSWKGAVGAYLQDIVILRKKKG